jgi:hypothetical protein
MLDIRRGLLNHILERSFNGFVAFDRRQSSPPQKSSDIEQPRAAKER